MSVGNNQCLCLRKQNLLRVLWHYMLNYNAKSYEHQLKKTAAASALVDA